MFGSDFDDRGGCVCFVMIVLVLDRVLLMLDRVLMILDMTWVLVVILHRMAVILESGDFGWFSFLILTALDWIAACRIGCWCFGSEFCEFGDVCDFGQDFRNRWICWIGLLDGGQAF